MNEKSERKNYLIDKILNQGIDSLSKSEYFEYLLILIGESSFDTLAQEMDDFFDNIALALDSTPEHVLEFTSASERGARLLTTLPLVFARIKSDIKSRYTHLPTISKTVNFLYYLLHLQQVEQSYNLVLDSAYKILKCTKVAEGTLTTVSFSNAVVAREAINTKRARYVILAHNHPDDDPHPSPIDEESTTNLTKIFDNLNLTLLDHIIVGSKSVYSMTKKKYFYANYTLTHIVCPLVKLEIMFKRGSTNYKFKSKKNGA